jgi:glutaredoxin
MRLIGKLIVIIILLGMLLGASAYIITYTDDNNNGGNDTTPPQITQITGNFTVTAGQTATITTLFSDNVNVTEATLYYKTADATSWSTISILDGSASITIPTSIISNYHYYITIDDAAGNGPIGDPSTDGSKFYIITVKPSGSNGDEDFTHTVFIEETTRQNCHFCPSVAKILESIESTHNYRFYYVSMVVDNSKAETYLKEIYNRTGDPTVIIDGGYGVIYGSNHPETDYTTAIQSAENRDVPQIRVTVTAEYKNTTNTLATTVLVINGEQATYTGLLQVYLTELISSQYNDYDGIKYKNAFVDFLIDQDITIPASSNKTFTASTSVGTLDYENLKLYAVVFSATENTAYSDPPGNTANFTAHYADAVNVTYVAEGTRNLPPEVGIVSPQKGKMYLRGNPILQFITNKQLLRNTWLIGKSSIDIYAKDDSKIVNVELYINDELVTTMNSSPYNYTIPSNFIKKPVIPSTYTILVKAYDDTGKTATASIDVKAWWVF